MYRQAQRRRAGICAWRFALTAWRSACRTLGRPTSRRSGSWIAREHQGKGYGTEARAAVLELAFVHLHAVEAYTSFVEGNSASERISRAPRRRPGSPSRGSLLPVWGYPRA
ncbi:GNAT family N-acetyltransferase [Nonomuraea sp. NPDC003201]